MCASNCCLPHAVIGGGVLLKVMPPPLQIPCRSCGSCGTLGAGGWLPRPPRWPRWARATDETRSKKTIAVKKRVNGFRIGRSLFDISRSTLALEFAPIRKNRLRKDHDWRAGFRTESVYGNFCSGFKEIHHLGAGKASPFQIGRRIH